MSTLSFHTTNTLYEEAPSIKGAFLLCYCVVVKYVVPIPEKVSLNKIYAGIHFSQRKVHKDNYHLAVLASKPEPWTGDFPVHVHYHFKLRGNRLDISNHAYMQKMVEDGLVACGVLPDDDQKYVSGITVTAEQIKKGEDDEVVIIIKSEL